MLVFQILVNNYCPSLGVARLWNIFIRNRMFYYYFHLSTISRRIVFMANFNLYKKNLELTWETRKMMSAKWDWRKTIFFFNNWFILKDYESSFSVFSNNAAYQSATPYFWQVLSLFKRELNPMKWTNEFWVEISKDPKEPERNKLKNEIAFTVFFQNYPDYGT